MAATSFVPDETLYSFPPGRFKVTGDIGRGAHAEVIQAYDFKLRRNVAIKLSFDPTSLKRLTAEDSEAHEADADLDQNLENMLALAAKIKGRYTPLREARLLAMVDHPNVIQVLDIGLLKGRMVAVVMPYLEGGTLAERELAGTWQEILDVALQIGWGLSALHDAGILHRDLKPNNILFDGDDRPRIADLGLACRTSDTEALAERVGTQEYMAPDVITRGFKDLRDDLYSFCMIVYEMLYGRPPFASAADRDHGRVSPPTRPGIPLELHEILVRGLAPDANDRWEAMKPLLRAMDRVRHPVQLPPPKPRPRRWPWAAVTAALVGGIAIGVVLDEGVARADECSDVMDELAPAWNESVQSELVGAFGTRKAGDGLDEWANRWLAVRAQECMTARDAGRPIDPTPCSASVRDRFQATVHAFRSPLLRRGLKFASVIAELPAPEHCIDHPEDADWGYGGLLELPNIDVEVEALARAGELEVAHRHQAEYMKLAHEQGSELGIARATYFRAEIHRLEGQLDLAAEEFEQALHRSIDIGLPVFTAECLLKLAAIAGERSDMGGVDAYSLVAHGLFARYRAERIAEVLQVQGLALVTGAERQRERGVALLLNAVEMREEQLRQQTGTREWLSQARESYARGLLSVDRAVEAIEYLDLALKMHQEEFGHGTWRKRTILMLKFSALIELRQFEDTEPVRRTILNMDAENWRRYAEDARWMADGYFAAGEIRKAEDLLHLGRARASEHGLSDEVERFDLALMALEHE